MPETFVELCWALDMPHAYILLAALEGGGVRAQINDQGLALEAVLGAVTESPRIYVHPDDANRAIEILDEVEAAEEAAAASEGKTSEGKSGRDADDGGVV